MPIDPFTIGGAIGSALAVYFAKRASLKAGAVETEVKGPGIEPSLRAMMTTSAQELAGYREQMTTEFDRLHDDLGATTSRMDALEASFKTLNSSVEALKITVHQGLEQRVSILEGAIVRDGQRSKAKAAKSGR